MYHTIIFDLDDTLTDDKENIREAFKIVMKYREENYNEEKFERFYTKDKKGNDIDKLACSEFWKEKDSYRQLQNAFYDYMVSHNFENDAKHKYAPNCACKHTIIMIIYFQKIKRKKKGNEFNYEETKRRI